MMILSILIYYVDDLDVDNVVDTIKYVEDNLDLVDNIKGVDILRLLMNDFEDVDDGIEGDNEDVDVDDYAYYK